MPRAPQHALTWFRDDGRYALFVKGRTARHFRLGDEETWQDWLGAVTSFAFHGSSGSLNVYQEERPRGGRYWYAYHTAQGHTHKRYLGRTATVSLARLEEVAAALSGGVTITPPRLNKPHRGPKRR